MTAVSRRLAPRHPFWALGWLFLAWLPFVAGADSQTDSAIEADAMASFNFRVVLARQVHVRAFAGRVTLTGRVEDEASKALALATVSLYPGVASVRNEVEVASSRQAFSDGWLAQAVERRLLVKRGVNPLTTFVSVEAGVATLDGTVVDEGQKALTARHVRAVDGIAAVNNRLVVKPDSFEEDRTMDLIDDISITCQVQSELRQNPLTQAHRATVSTRQHLVTITGLARSAVEKAVITQLAGEVRGVLTVTNNMLVQP